MALNLPLDLFWEGLHSPEQTRDAMVQLENVLAKEYCGVSRI